VLLSGIDGQILEVRAHLAADHPRAGLLDQLDAAETLDRIRAAVRNSNLQWPDAPVTLSLSLPVRLSAAVGGDLAVAGAVLAASGVLPAERVAHTMLLGELGLDGRVRPVRGLLPAVLAARRAGLRVAIVPRAGVPEASMVSDMVVLGADRLAEVIAYLRDEPFPPAGPGTMTVAAPSTEPDLADVVGQPEGAAALEIAAAGGHHLLLLGMPGSGATMLARRLPGLLPDLSPLDALEVTAIHSISGSLPPETPLITRPPLVAPHHSSSAPAMLGGGVGRARPGAISQAHRGVLFLQDAAEFGSHRLEALCAALDDGEVRLARRDGVARYPARFQLVLASPWCPCLRPESDCSCSPHAKRRYLARLAGPLLDRIDLRVRLRPIPPAGAQDLPVPDPTAMVRERVQQARDRAARRWAQYGVVTNAEVPRPILRRDFALPRSATALLDRGLASGAVTARGADRCIRVAWTLADLAGLDTPGIDEMAAALEFRDRRAS
jgi:magnesium chelatase family protein